MVNAIKSCLLFLLKAKLQTGGQNGSQTARREYGLLVAVRVEVLFLPQTSSSKHMVSWVPGTPAAGVGSRILLQGNKDNIAMDSGWLQGGGGSVASCWQGLCAAVVDRAASWNNLGKPSPADSSFSLNSGVSSGPHSIVSPFQVSQPPPDTVRSAETSWQLSLGEWTDFVIWLQNYLLKSYPVCLKVHQC